MREINGVRSIVYFLYSNPDNASVITMTHAVTGFKIDVVVAIVIELWSI